MAKYRKKPVVVEAMQWIGPDRTEIAYLRKFDEWMAANRGKRECRYRGASLIISTLEGNHVACPGDWIIRGVKGEIYPCKPDIFEQTYEEVK